MWWDRWLVDYAKMDEKTFIPFDEYKKPRSYKKKIKLKKKDKDRIDNALNKILNKGGVI